MEKKFLGQGLSRQEIFQWKDELDRTRFKERVPYDDVKPVLDYLEDALAINPTRVLNQWYLRYESGELKSVSETVFEYALRLKEETQRVIHLGSRFELENLREKISGKRKGYVLFSEIEEDDS